MEEETEAIEEVYRHVEAACNAGVAHDLAAVFTEDAVYIPPAGPLLHGRPAIEERYVSTFEQATCQTEWFPEELAPVGDWAFVRGRFSITMTPRAEGQSETHRQLGRFLDVLHRQPGGPWKIARHMFSAQPAPESDSSD